MASKNNRLKSPATAVSIPQNFDQASAVVAEIGAAQRELQRIEAAMNDALATIKEEFEIQAAPIKGLVETKTKALQIWGEANRATLTREGKVKTAQLPAGEIGWRTRPPRCLVRGEEAVIETLRRIGLARFIRTKEEVNKEACLNEAAVAKSVPGISITQGEDFFVQPFEAELANTPA